jgi:hypothetical protein
VGPAPGGTASGGVGAPPARRNSPNLDQAEREPAGSPPELFDVGVSSALLLPALVGVAVSIGHFCALQ